MAIYETVRKMAGAAADLAAGGRSRRIAENGRAPFMAATGASQFAFPDALTRRSQVDWARTEMFHLDECISLPETHPAGFRRCLQERLLDVVHPGRVHLISKNAADPWQKCARLGAGIAWGRWVEGSPSPGNAAWTTTLAWTAAAVAAILVLLMIALHVTPKVKP